MIDYGSEPVTPLCSYCGKTIDRFSFERTIWGEACIFDDPQCFHALYNLWAPKHKPTVWDKILSYFPYSVSGFAKLVVVLTIVGGILFVFTSAEVNVSELFGLSCPVPQTQVQQHPPKKLVRERLLTKEARP